MTLAKRLLAGLLVLVILLVAVVVAIAGSRLRDRLAQETRRELEREARLVASNWKPGGSADSLANAAGAALSRRVTLIDSSGVVVGDSEFDGDDLKHLQNHASRPEVIEANHTGLGWSMRPSARRRRRDALAVKHRPASFACRRDATKFREIAAARGATCSSPPRLPPPRLIMDSRSLKASETDHRARDVARAIAAGEPIAGLRSPPRRSRRSRTALHRMTEQLASRLSALESEDALLNAVIESLDEGILAVNPRGETVRLNQSARRLLSLTATVPFSMDLLPQERLVRDAMRTAMRGTATEPSELALGDRTLLITARPLPTAARCLRSWTTTRRRLETIRRLRRQRLAMSSRHATVIGVSWKSLRDTELPAKIGSDFSETIESNTRRMQRIVDDLLDLSIQSSWIPNIVSNDLGGIVSDAFTAVHRSAEAKGLTLAFEANDRRVDADLTALRQISATLLKCAAHGSRIDYRARRAWRGWRNGRERERYRVRHSSRSPRTDL